MVCAFLSDLADLSFDHLFSYLSSHVQAARHQRLDGRKVMSWAREYIDQLQPTTMHTDINSGPPIFIGLCDLAAYSVTF